ncbi:MAG: 4Fe-4S dicluster domain-containing protein [Planctomycetota bacterium]
MAKQRSLKRTGKIFVRHERCMACHACELACAVAHSAARDLRAAIAAGERPQRRLAVESYQDQAVPVHCNHCDDAPCRLVCPSGAIHRDEEGGPVLFNRENCIGCRMCVQACPFGVLTVDREGRSVLKCDLCVARLAEGLEPACVAACPSGALTFGEEEAALRTKRRTAAGRIVAARESARAKEGRE